MAYTPYYDGGWQSGEEGGTPITPAALNHMEEGIEAANALGDPVGVEHGGTHATTAAQARANLGITPANIGAYGSDSAGGTITDANDTGLYGTRFFTASACDNLPTNTSGHYYMVMFLGTAQIAIRFSAAGSPLVYTRYYTNQRWYPWTPIASVDTIGAVAKAGDTMTGDLFIERASGAIRFKDPSQASYAAAIQSYINGGKNRFQIHLRDNDSTGLELYQLPAPDARSSNQSYSILTSKSAVTVAQGGTGASTAAGARGNLSVAQRLQMYNANYTTWADVYAALTALDTYTVANVYIDTAVSSIVTDGKVTNAVLIGTVTDFGTAFRFTVRNSTGNKLYNITITSATAESRNTTVYEFAGTAL